MSRYDFSSVVKTVRSTLRVPSPFATCAECSPLWQRRAAVQASHRRAHTSMSGSSSGRAFSISARRKDSSALSQRSIRDLGEKAEMEIGMRGRLASVVPPRRCKEVSHRVGSKFGGAHSLKWTTPPKTVLLAKKSNDPKTTAAAKRIVRHLLDDYDGLSIVVEKPVYDDLQAATDSDDQALLQQLVVLEESDRSDLVSKVDLVVTLGGDGTVLHVASLFANGAVPPILGVSMGTLGFLMPFNLKQFKGAFREVMQSEASLLLRMRLQCAIHDASGELVSRNDDTGSQALNEVHLHRGRHPHLTIIETFVDGQHLTEAISDGLIVSTPTGSTAYSLSAGGPIVHPSVPSLLLTPICPRSLSFRSVLLPSDVCIQMRISPKSRAPAELSLDGRSVQFLEPGEYLSVSMSRYPVPCIVPTSKITTPGIPQSVLCKPQQAQVDAIAGRKEGRGASSGQDEVLDGGWVQDINGMLSFNKAFVTKGMMKHIGDD